MSFSKREISYKAFVYPSKISVFKPTLFWAVPSYTAAISPYDPELIEAKKNNIKTVLEIGTAIGYSGSIMMAAGLEKLVTIDKNAEYLKLARENFASLGFGHFIFIGYSNTLL